MQLSNSVLQALLMGTAWAAPADRTAHGKFLGPRRAPLYPGSGLVFSNNTAPLEKRRLPEYPGINMNDTEAEALEKRRLPEYPGININETDSAAAPPADEAEPLVKRRTAVYPGTEYQPSKKPEPKPEWNPEWKPEDDENEDDDADEDKEDEGTDCAYDSDEQKAEYIPQLPKEYLDYLNEDEEY